MTGFALYEVIGHRAYRGHDRGTRFEANLDPAAEKRAIARGDIRVVERREPTLEPGSYSLPKDWPLGEADAGPNEAARAASLTSEGG